MNSSNRAGRSCPSSGMSSMMAVRSSALRQAAIPLRGSTLAVLFQAVTSYVRFRGRLQLGTHPRRAQTARRRGPR